MAKRPNDSEYVERPRYGKSPRYTGLDPDRNDADVRLHWNTGILSNAMLAEYDQDLRARLLQCEGNQNQSDSGG